LESLRRLSENLFLFADTCNVYVMRNGDRAILIDFGSGAVLDALAEIGVEEVEAVLHTHHHRDQCQGDGILNERGIPIAVPARERHLFEDVEAFWRHRQLLANYDVQSDSYTLRRSVQVSHELADYNVYRWRGLELSILPTPGHTRGSVTLVGDVDGETVAFSGDLISGPGKVWRVHDLQWAYMATDGLNASISSLDALRRAKVDRLLPSHGSPIGRPQAAIDQLIENLSRLFQVVSFTPEPVSAPDLAINPRFRQVSKHLWLNASAVANFYAIVTDEGEAMLLDYGYASQDHAGDLRRFVEHSIRELMEVAAVKSIDIVIPSHYHDDHVSGIPTLQREYGTQLWAHEIFSDILEHPGAYDLACLPVESMRVDRVLKEGEEFDWAGFRFQTEHAPGHTHFAAHTFVRVDGLKLALTGDNILSSMTGPRIGGPVYRNRFELDGFQTSIRKLIEFEPQMLLTGHSAAISVSPEVLEEPLHRAEELATAFDLLTEEEEATGFSIDPRFVAVRPYRARVAAGGELDLAITLRNHRDEEAVFTIVADLPNGWKADPDSIEIEVAGGATVMCSMKLNFPRRQTPGRKIAYCLDVTVGDRRFGQEAEGLVDVLDPASVERDVGDGAASATARH
jgi:glyoxylase-like metal-dependent hydrolase (beta-lactamase superfamily II)